ncbi:hypothetical protein [Streptomyces canus]|uniref:hypothetical protein n=1 Tax=Streptomyces canus TaxID=58343 RepID=UPI0018F8687B|nr:hypothetical protein [Streptomyces canus]
MATGTALTPLPSGTGFGADGIKVHDDAVWVSNTDRGMVLRIPVRRNGSAGPIETRATGLGGIDDFAFTSRHGDTVLAAVNAGRSTSPTPRTSPPSRTGTCSGPT